MIIRDSQGDIMACLCTSVDFILNPAIAEAYVLRRVMKFCLDLGVQSAIFKGDALSVVQATNNKDEIWIEMGSTVEDTRKMLSQNLSWSVVYMYREVNCITDTLVKLAIQFVEEKVWIEEGPVHILNMVLKEKYRND